MDEPQQLAGRFERQRGRLLGLAYRMLGGMGEAEDAVQEAWLRLSRADTADVANLDAWLTTVVSRICLDMLRTRGARREEPLDAATALLRPAPGRAPEEEAALVDSVGRALLVVLDRLGPDERVAFVLHDLFAVPFEQIAPIVDRSAATTKKLASRARARVRGEQTAADPDLPHHRAVVQAFLDAARGGDIAALLRVLAPEVVRTADPAALPAGAVPVVRGADAVVRETLLLRTRAAAADLALVDGRVGVVVAPAGRLLLALRITVADGRVAGYEVVAEPARLARLSLAVLD
ncbi:sigma-70 family RNA polymerase sigma factor [Nocardia farcinica]|uniref:sigma-70 family RNA polymerase sigma factor n=1 Tax=Nocardia farcinica TaxID=37329 RepID=UPI0024576F37|nr:sigma-70 family RNA polymerase sigma factor [Nocardia farcinica]